MMKLLRDPWVWLITGALTLIATWGFVEMAETAQWVNLLLLVTALPVAGIVTWCGARLWLIERDKHTTVSQTDMNGERFHFLLITAVLGTLILATATGVLIFMIIIVIMGGIGVLLPMIRKRGDGEDLTDAEAVRYSARRLARWTFAVIAWVIFTGLSGIMADFLDDLPAWQDALIYTGVMLVVTMGLIYFMMIFPYRRVIQAWHHTAYDKAEARLALLRFAHPLFGENFFSLRGMVGGILLMGGKYAQAEVALRAALPETKKPDDKNLDDSGETDKADEQELVVADSDGAVESWLSLTLLAQGASDDALRVIEQLLIHQPDNVIAHATLAELLVEMGDATDYPRARESIQIALDNNDFEINFITRSIGVVDRRSCWLALRAWITAEMQDSQQVEAHLATSKAHHDDHALPPLFDARWHYFMGRAYNAIGDTNNAETHFQTATNIDTSGDINKRITQLSNGVSTMNAQTTQANLRHNSNVVRRAEND